VKAAEPLRVLAIASAGGHWIQLRRLRPAFEGVGVLWVTTKAGYRIEMAAEEQFAVVPDANRWNKIMLAWSAFRILHVILRYRPHVVVTTGAAPGYLAILFAKGFGARTLWVDSIANADELSMSGRLAMKTADEVLTQWRHVARGDRPAYRGAIL